MTLSRQDAPGIMAVIAFSADFGHDPQALEKDATSLLVPQDVLVDCLVAYGEGTMLPQMVGDLLRAPFGLQEAHDDLPLAFRELGSTPCAPTARRGTAVRDLSPVAVVMGCPVPGKLTADRARVTAQLQRYLGL